MWQQQITNDKEMHNIIFFGDAVILLKDYIPKDYIPTDNNNIICG